MILLIPSISIGWISYEKASEEVLEQVTDRAIDNIESVNSQITELLNSKIDDMDYLSTQLNASMVDGFESPQARSILNQYISTNPEFQQVYFGTQQGLMFRSPELKEKLSNYDPRERPWYINAMNNKGKTVINDPLVVSSTGEVVVIHSRATADGSGVVGGHLDLSKLKERVSGIKVGKEGYVVVMDRNQNYLIHPTIQAGEKASDDFIKKFYEEEKGSFDFVFNGGEKKAVFVTNPMSGWKIIGSLELKEISEETSGILYSTVLTVLISLLVGGLLIWIIVRSIIGPLNELVDSTHRISNGDLTHELNIKSKDELGVLSDNFNVMTKNLRQLINQINTGAEQVATSSEELLATTEQATQATDQISSAIQEMASGSETQVTSTQESSRAMEEVSLGIQRIAEFSATVSDSAEDTKELAKQGDLSIQRAIHQMESIEKGTQNTTVAINQLYDRSQEIGQIIGVITGIADQTNLLSLNAAIEAARAGEHGRGFAIVANEVKKLAEQSRESANQIIELIQEVQKDTEEANKEMEKNTNEVILGKTVIQETGEVFEKILTAIEKVNVEIQEVSATSEQISANSQQVAASVDQLAEIAMEASEGSQHVAAASEEQLASMEEITTSAQSLSELALELQTIVAKFKV